jgi:hypothetical protein
MNNLANLVNLTPHAINIVGSNGAKTVIPPSGKVARVKTADTIIDSLDLGVSVVSTTVTGVEGFDDIPQFSSVIVSSMVLDNLPAKLPYRAYAPDTGATALRNAEGQIEAVTRLRTR